MCPPPPAAVPHPPSTSSLSSSLAFLSPSLPLSASSLPLALSPLGEDCSEEEALDSPAPAIRSAPPLPSPAAETIATAPKAKKRRADDMDLTSSLESTANTVLSLAKQRVNAPASDNEDAAWCNALALSMGHLSRKNKVQLKDKVQQLLVDFEE